MQGERHLLSGVTAGRVPAPFKTERAMDDQTIEQEIQSKGQSALRIISDEIEAAIQSEHYITRLGGFDGHCGDLAALKLDKEASSRGVLALCVLKFKNGFTVVGESACTLPEDFEEEIARGVARRIAVQRIWQLEKIRLRCKLAETGLARTSAPSFTGA